ncbi:MAG: hypothetical protein ACO3K1_09090 [Synechococcus sp.]|jgi:hypothetical protein|uniref:hypothetical protein n=2 Tax=unclassified Synechococcus TaxID=2626047 RepID=UPI0016268A53|nr:hypothetical protein [Synechococcus sp. LTW-R]QNG30566.1 hypothetical protein H0O22_05590 [Synechococcus sp. LTW-R]
MNTRYREPLMTAPVPWSLAWSKSGELAPQDRFDLLQTLVAIETEEVQPALVMAVESMSVAELTALSSESVTGLCA